MEATAGIRFGQKTIYTKLSPLQAAEIAASKYGFYDLDVEQDNGRIVITASAHNRTVRARGDCMSQAVEQMLEMFTNDQ